MHAGLRLPGLFGCSSARFLTGRFRPPSTRVFASSGNAALDLSRNLKSREMAVNLMMCTAEVEAKVMSLIEAGTSGKCTARQVLDLGDGEWEVFYMPHIQGLADPLGLKVVPLAPPKSIVDIISFSVNRFLDVSNEGFFSAAMNTWPSRFTSSTPSQSINPMLQIGDGNGAIVFLILVLQVQPLRYTVRGSELQTDVRIGHSSLSMWLSSMSSVKAEGEATVKLSMTKFWVSTSGNIPRSVTERDDTSSFDVFVNWLCRAAFIERASAFPVVFFDDDAGICVFQFPPLKANIAAVRVSRL